MDLGIKGKTALIIGASQGIGYELSNTLAQEGVNLLLLSRNEAKLQALASQLSAKNSAQASILCQWKALDLLRENSAQILIDWCAGYQIDIIVYCYHVDLPSNLRQELNLKERWQRLYQINFELPLLLNDHFIPQMRQQQWGRIIHTCSVASLEAQGSVEYVTFKAMLGAYVKALGRKEAKNGVILSGVLPGAFAYKDSTWYNIQRQHPEYVESFLQEQQPIGRFASPEELANFIAFLCSSKASFNAGGLFTVDGGLCRALYQD